MRVVPLAGVLLCAGCVETTVVKRNVPLAGLPGARTALTEVGSQDDAPALGPAGSPRTEHEDGTVALRSRSFRHLMGHIYETVRDGERELFVDQVLSKRTREEFEQRALDPGLAFDELVRRREWVAELFERMPQGEFTPGVMLEKQGRRVYRLKLIGIAKEGLHWTYMDAVNEHGHWKLRWFGS